MRPFLLLALAVSLLAAPLHAEFKAGSAIVDVTPKEFPVLVNGGMTSRSIEKVKTPLKARSFAFSDGKELMVVAVVDSCMMPRPLLDEVKKRASEKSDLLEPDRILISATHTHTAGSCMGALGTDADPVYSLFLKKKLVEAVLAPLKNMRPAEIGWGAIDAGDYTALRRWVIHPSAAQEDPFGNLTVRANMHAASNWDNVIGPSGPEDPTLSMIAVRSTDGKPIGLLANFSMHYYGDRDISADYFGLFANGLQEKIGPDNDGFVAAMSHGCSGDIWRHDYEKSPDRAGNKNTIDNYAAELVDLAFGAYGSIEYSQPDSIAMAETRLDLAYRVPDVQLLEWSQRIIDQMGDRSPKTKPEVYAREQIILHEKQRTEVVVQALRIGNDISIATTPNETYALTGLKIKNASPTEHTMTIELANGGDGYIPPPEQHRLGGYNTWAARSAGLEVEAEPKITAAAIGLLEQVTGNPRTDRRPENGSAAEHILSLNPKAYYRMDEFSGPRAIDASPNHLDAIYGPRVLFYVAGPNSKAFSASGVNRAAHFAGDRLRVRVPGLLGKNYTFSLWFWSGSSDDAMTEPEWIFSRGNDFNRGAENIGVAMDNGVRRIFADIPGLAPTTLSRSSLERWKWNHLALVRMGMTCYIFLNGERVGGMNSKHPRGEITPETFFFGGSSSDENNFEGKLDEIAIFDRALSQDAIEELHETGAEK